LGINSRFHITLTTTLQQCLIVCLGHSVRSRVNRAQSRFTDKEFENLNIVVEHKSSFVELKETDTYR
jgi:hypothetical protein